MVNYTYNAWGEIISTTGTLASTIGAVNKLRYRSYYYDTESGLYYLQSRYYDPIVKRFISPDSTDYLTENGDFDGYNLYAYCLNNPVMYVDKKGTDAVILLYKRAARGMGHMGALVQDSKKAWYYFYWGAITGITINLLKGESCFPYCKFDKLPVKSITAKSVSFALMSSDIQTGKFFTSDSISYSAGLTNYYYIKGDFTKTYSYFKQLYNNRTSFFSTRYNLFDFNCMHAVINGLLRGTFSSRNSYRKNVLRMVYEISRTPNVGFNLLTLMM